MVKLIRMFGMVPETGCGFINQLLSTLTGLGILLRSYANEMFGSLVGLRIVIGGRCSEWFFLIESQ